MSEFVTTVSTAVETGTKKLLDHFKDQYGSIIFIPLWVNSGTPAKIAPMVSKNIDDMLLNIDEDKVTINIVEDKIWVIFDSFVDSFYNSLSFLWKTAMKTLDMKMSRNDYVQWLSKRKTEKPDSYNTWKTNLVLVLQMIFDEIIIAFNGLWKSVSLSNWNQYFWSSKEAIEAMKIFQ